MNRILNTGALASAGRVDGAGASNNLFDRYRRDCADAAPESVFAVRIGDDAVWSRPLRYFSFSRSFTILVKSSDLLRR
jgi:hypothetical protein